MKSIILIFIVIFVLNSHHYLFAQKEQIETTTYYPSPSGSYDEVEVKNGVVFKPQTNIDTLPCDASVEGRIIYGTTSTDPVNKFYYCGEGSNIGWHKLQQQVAESTAICNDPYAECLTDTQPRKCSGADLLTVNIKTFGNFSSFNNICRKMCGMVIGATCVWYDGYQPGAPAGYLTCRCSEGSAYDVSAINNWAANCY